MEYINYNNTLAITVWYNPTQSEISAINSYYNDIKGIIIVDNSDYDNSQLIRQFDNITYLPQYKNLGIATALNIGCSQAIAQGAKWVLTMDQDSQWDKNSVREYIQEANTYDNIEQVGIFSPYHDCDGHPETHHRNGRYEQKKVTMCSGNLLNIEVWKETGGFRDDFFIDLVDDEICCHLRKLGYQIVVLNNILLTHKLGQGIKYSRFLRHPYIPHPTWRYYYIARNIRLMMTLYPNMKKYYHQQVFKYLKRITLYDNTNKWAKIYNFYRGWKNAMTVI